ncbi:hypothetical protein [Porphyrobacter sp. YT40]|nr:hypothetical protein [Porphyrobacter sp. YT40]
MTFPIRYHRPARPRPEASALVWLAPGLLLAGAMVGHLIDAVVR